MSLNTSLDPEQCTASCLGPLWCPSGAEDGTGCSLSCPPLIPVVEGDRRPGPNFSLAARAFSAEGVGSVAELPPLGEGDMNKAVTGSEDQVWLQRENMFTFKRRGQLGPAQSGVRGREGSASGRVAGDAENTQRPWPSPGHCPSQPDSQRAQVRGRGGGEV